jgi:hypothetical protein
MLACGISRHRQGTDPDPGEDEGNADRCSDRAAVGDQEQIGDKENESGLGT